MSAKRSPPCFSETEGAIHRLGKQRHHRIKRERLAPIGNRAGSLFLDQNPVWWVLFTLSKSAAPLAMVAEQAGGLATTGMQSIMDVEPESLHMRVPLIIGSKDDVNEYLGFVSSESVPAK